MGTDLIFNCLPTPDLAKVGRVGALIVACGPSTQTVRITRCEIGILLFQVVDALRKGLSAALAVRTMLRRQMFLLHINY